MKNSLPFVRRNTNSSAVSRLLHRKAAAQRKTVAGERPPATIAAAPGLTLLIEALEATPSLGPISL